MSTLEDRRVLVTGAGGAIGAAVARAVAAAGAAMVLVGRRTGPLEAVRGSLAGEGHAMLAFDVADDAAWATHAKANAFDRVDGVVTAAALLSPVGQVGRYDPAEFRRTLDVNVTGTLLAIHHTLPSLRAARGSVVTYSGGGATGPLARYDGYAASKAAVVRLTENLAVGLAGDGIRVNAVAPGFVASAMHEVTLQAGPDRAGADYHARTARQLVEGGVPAEQAAELTTLLLSAESEGITGKLLSAQWDAWRDPAFLERLRTEPDLATLRRIDDQFFSAVPAGARA